MIEPHGVRRSRPNRHLALLACCAIVAVQPAGARAEGNPTPLRAALPVEPDVAAAERRARALLSASNAPRELRGSQTMLGRAIRTGASATLPGVGAMFDRGPLADGSARRARLRHEGPIAGSRAVHLGSDETAAPSDSIFGSMRGALATNEGIQASLHRAEAAAHELARARGAMLPKLTLNAEIGTDDPTEKWHHRRKGRADVALAMPLFSSGSRLNAVRAAEARRDAAELTVLAEERREMLRAATAFLDVAASLRTVQALEENVSGMAKTLRAARALAAAGEAGTADIALAEANLASAHGELASGRQALQRARIDHRSLTGRDVGEAVRMPRTDHLVPADLERVVAHALARSPDANAGWRNADAQRFEAKAAHGSIGPSVSLTASVGRDYARLEGVDEWNDWDAAVGVRLSMPLVDAEALPRVRGARARARAAEWDARDTAREIERRIHIAHAAHGGAVERQRHAATRLRAVQRALTATRAEYDAGFVAITEVTQAQIDLARARIELASLEKARHRAAYTLALAAEIPID